MKLIELAEKSQYGLHEGCFLDWFNVPQLQEFKNLDPKAAASGSSQILKKKDTFFHGRYLKYSAQLGDSEYILKIREDSCPELPLTEFVCNQIAEVLDIAVPQFHFIDYEGNPTFVTRNFMQDHVGTLHHIYKFLPEGEDFHCCEEIIKIIENETGKPSEIANFIEICLFDSLVGNNDRHGRNLGIIQTTKWKKLAPMYDNPSYLGTVEESLLGAHFSPSGCIWTRDSSEPKPKDYMLEFKRLGHGQIVSGFVNKVTSRIARLQEVINNSLLTDKRKSALSRLLTERGKDFIDVR